MSDGWELLSSEEIDQMFAYLFKFPPQVEPPPDLSFFGVRRIAATLTFLRDNLDRVQYHLQRMAGERQDLLHERDEAVAHRDDYENRCIEQSIEIRRLKAEVARLTAELKEAEEFIRLTRG